jgi:5-methylcytosine-specific restriction protein A
MSAPSDDRPSAARRGYGRRWRKVSAAYLRAHPLCECRECKEAGRPVPATVVDHIVPHRGDQDLFWDETNWQAMAKPCHDRKTAAEDGGFGRRRAQT